LSAIGGFVGGLIESATEAAARAWAGARGPKAEGAGPASVDVAQHHAAATEQAATPLRVETGEGPHPVEPLVSAVDPCAITTEMETGEGPHPVEPQRLGEAVAEQAPAKASASPPFEGATSDGHKSWTRLTTRRIRTRIEEVFGLDVCRETVRRVLHRLGLSWKKAKKLLAKANPEKRRAFVVDIRALLDRVLHDENLVLVYIDEAHVHQDADMGYGWSPRGRRLYVASSSPGLHAKVSFYGVYLYSESQVRIWEYPRANGEHTIEVLQRLRDEFAERPMIVIWDGAPWHRSACVLDAAARLAIEIVRLPAYSPDFMPVEALWHWLRESVTYNHCHDTAAELIARVAAFVAMINRDACALADRLWVKDELDPEEEELRFST
jgi:transposase